MGALLIAGINGQVRVVRARQHFRVAPRRQTYPRARGDKPDR